MSTKDAPMGKRMKTIRTIEELDALPEGAVISKYQPDRVGSRNYKVAVKPQCSLRDNCWEVSGFDARRSSKKIDWILPAQLLWPVEEPARPTECCGACPETTTGYDCTCAGNPRCPKNAPDIIIISCGKKKLDHPAPARDMYTSQYFKAMRGYAEASGKPWFILSAKYGLLDPETTIYPYDLTIGQLGDPYLTWWRVRVARRLIQDFGDPGIGKKLRNLTVELHAGRKYTDEIDGVLGYWGAVILQPTAGLQIGERLAWYKKQREATS